MSVLRFVLLVLAGVAVPAVGQPCVAEVFVLFDGSESIIPEFFDEAVDLFRNASVVAEGERPGLRWAFAEYSLETTIVSSQYNLDPTAISADLDSIVQTEDITNTASAIFESSTFIRGLSDPNLSDIFILITDGPTSFPDSNSLEDAVATLFGFDRIVLGIDNVVDQEELDFIAGDEGMVLTATFADLQAVLTPLVDSILSFCPPSM